MSIGFVRVGAPDPSGAADPLDLADAADPACAADPPYPADLLRWRDLSGLSYLYDESRYTGQRAGHGPGPFDAHQPPGGRPRSRTLVVALITALVSALVGGLAGGYIGSRSGGAQSSYSLGTVPPALTDRPPDSVAGIAARVLPGVVMIKVDGGEGTGSGFIVRGGYIITNNHVVTLDGQLTHARLQVVFNGGQTEPARLIGTDPYSDIAVIKPQRVPSLPALALGNSASVQVGDPVVAFGSPLGLAGTVTSGIVSALNRPVQPSSGGAGSTPQVFYDAIQTDAPINPGNSGGPLVNGQAQVVGVTAAIDTLGGDPAIGVQGGSIGLGFAIPINQARQVATELIRTGHAAHSVLGALLNTTYRGTGAEISRLAVSGVPPVSPGGPAARAGLRPGDVITRFAGQRIGNAASLLDVVRSRQPGDQVAVTFTRHGASRTVMLTLGSAESLVT
jgi:S1-C subfamily serine protease